MTTSSPTSRSTSRRAVLGAGILAAAAMGVGLASAVSAAPRAPASPHARSAEVATGHSRSLGTFLIDGRSGRTLYLFEKDGRNRSRCRNSCTSVWPPLMTSGRPRAAGAAKSSKLGRIKRGSGWQVTYNGHPLYRYVGDDRSGTTSGEGIDSFGAQWYVVNPRGNRIDND